MAKPSRRRRRRRNKQPMLDGSLSRSYILLRLLSWLVPGEFVRVEAERIGEAVRRVLDML